jgi:hypothetical protein
MPATADLENVKAAKVQDGILVIEIPVTFFPQSTPPTAHDKCHTTSWCLCTLRAGAAPLPLPDTKARFNANVCPTAEEAAAGTQGGERGVRQQETRLSRKTTRIKATAVHDVMPLAQRGCEMM